MKRPSILAGILWAFVVAALAVPVWWGLRYLAPFPVAFKSALIIVYLCYLAYLLWTKGGRVGSLTLAAGNAALAVAVCLVPLTIPATAGLLAVLLSLNRSLLWQRSLASMVLDGALTTVALVFAGHLYSRSGSLPVSMWGFLLLQSLWVLVPARISLITGTSESQGGFETDRFRQGHRQAESALERMAEEVAP